MMNPLEIQDRAAGAIMGAFIGDALALGPHWYYDLSELRRDYGEWIDDYTDPKPGRYHDGLKAGQSSQAGFILELLLRSLVENKGYDEQDFCRRMDEELFPLIDGTPISGPGNYTSQSIRDAWRKRVQQNLPWGQTGGHADTTEAIERTLAIAVRYAFQPDKLAAAISDNTILTQNDDTVVSMTVAFGAVLGQLVQGNRLDSDISAKLMKLVKSGALPFHAVTNDDLQPPKKATRIRHVQDVLLLRMHCCHRLIWRKRPLIRIFKSTRLGKSPSFTACHAPFTINCLRRIICPLYFIMILSQRYYMP